MKLAPVLPLKKKSRTQKSVEGVIRFFQGKKGKKSKSIAPKPGSLKPGSLKPGSATPGSSYPRSSQALPGFIDAQAALLGDSQAYLAPIPRKRRKKPKKNPFLSTPVPETFRPPAPLGPLPAVHAPALRPASIESFSAPPTIEKRPSLTTAPAPERSFSRQLEKRFPQPGVILDSKDHMASDKAFSEVIEPRTIELSPAGSARNTLSPLATPAPVAAVRKATTTAIRAVAVAHENANAVGTVELTCTADGLLLQFVRISSYTEGYVPYPVTSGERIEVPYDKVARVDVDTDGLVHLTLDPSCTPYHRLALAGLAKDPAFDHRMGHRRRKRIERNITLVSLLAWIPAALALRAALPDLSSIIVMGIAVSLSVVLHMLRGDLASKVVLFNSSTKQVRDELLGELRYRLAPGRLRTNVASAQEPEPSTSQALPWSPFGDAEGQETGSLRGLFVTAGVVAAAATIAILVGKNLLFSSQEQQAQWGHDQQEAWAFLEQSKPAAEPIPTSSTITPDPTPVVPPPPPCSCERSDSPLWDDGIPRMSVLAHNRPGTTSQDRPSVYPEIAVVNNSSEDLKDIVMVVDFILGPRDGSQARVVGKQDLFWEGILAPGKAVKWRVRGRGDDYSVTSFVSGMLGQDGIKPAPGDAFYKLAMTANTPSVRLHGAKMLAYLGDERVGEGIEKLRQESKEEMLDTVEQIASAARPLRVCSVQSEVDPKVSGQLKVKACVYNASSASVDNPIVTARATLSDAYREARWTLSDTLPSKTGLLTSGFVELPATGEPSEASVWVRAER